MKPIADTELDRTIIEEKDNKHKPSQFFLLPKMKIKTPNRTIINPILTSKNASEILEQRNNYKKKKTRKREEKVHERGDKSEKGRRKACKLEKCVYNSSGLFVSFVSYSVLVVS